MWFVVDRECFIDDVWIFGEVVDLELVCEDYCGWIFGVVFVFCEVVFFGGIYVEYVE